jgi:hypothetical protein
MKIIQNLIIHALKKSGHTVVLIDRELRIRWVAGLRRNAIGAPVNALWRGARLAQGQVHGLLRELSRGNGGSAEGKFSGRGRNRMRIDFIPLRDASGEVEGFAAVRQKVGAATTGLADGVAEIYELLFELNADELSGLLAT